MKELTLKQMAQWCNGEILPEGADAKITGIQHDSRDIHPGELFVAIAGEHFDGHSFVPKAIAVLKKLLPTGEKNGRAGRTWKCVRPALPVPDLWAAQHALGPKAAAAGGMGVADAVLFVL